MSKTTLEMLDLFIDATSPKLATFLHHQINRQQNAVTYKALQQAIKQGQFPLSYLEKWQQDYSQFIIDYYTPLVEKALKQAAADLSASYSAALHDPQIGLMDSFIKDHGGKLIREVTTTQYTAINQLVRQATMTDTMTVDQLARAIRPCVGLTQRQAQYVKHYCDNLIEQGYDQKTALDKEAAYAGKVHRQRAMTIAETEMAFAYNAAADEVVQQSIKDGVFAPGVKKRWLTAYDERVCDQCGAIDGETVDIDAPFSIGVQLPPAHPRCRCAVAYDDITVLAPATPANAAEPQETVQQPTIPDDYDPGQLTYSGSNSLGTGEMHQYTDEDGNEWLFKPAQSKYGSHSEPFRAYVQEAGYKVQGIVDPDSAVPVKALTLDTPNGSKFGAAQLRITGVDSSFNLKAWQAGYGSSPDASVLSQIQRENVTDWLMCNFDGHGGNFIRLDGSGKLIGIDKEQAFKYLYDPDSKKMSFTYHPNSKYGETEPIYNTIYRKFAKGEIDLNLNDVLPYIKRVESIPDSAYREIFRDYAEALYGKGAKAEKLLDDIVSRKQGLRSSFKDFYSDLLTQRTGKNTVFQFADEVATAASSPLQAVAMSSSSLKAMPLTDLKALAQKRGIKYAWNMNKAQLVDAISDPTKTAQIVADAKARAYGVGTTPKAKTPKVTPKATQAGNLPKIDGITQLGDAMNDIDKALASSSPRGAAFISDATALEGMESNLRKITIDGVDYYELSGKLTNERWKAAASQISGQNFNQWMWYQTSGQIDYSKPILNMTSVNTTFHVKTEYIKNGNDLLVLAGKDAEYGGRALMGQFTIRVQASNGADAAAQIKQLISKAGMDDILDTATDAAALRYKKMRLIWQTAPSEAAKLSAKSTDLEIDAVMKRIGITPQRLAKAQFKKVQDGYFTLYDPENISLAKKHNVAYLYHEAWSEDAVVNVIKSGELLSTTNRYGRGIFVDGASSSTDIETGGADSVFTRIVFNNQIGKEERYGSFGNYVFIFDKSSLERTDWYAYRSDKFGTTKENDFTKRLGTEEHFEKSKNRYSRSNELLFRNTLPLDTLKEIRVPKYSRQPLIDKLHSEGIMKINGIRIEDFIKEGGKFL